MIIIKKGDTYTYRTDALECECRLMYISDNRIPYCDVTFRVDLECVPLNDLFLQHLLSLFSRICREKSYFIPHFSFRICDILLLSQQKEESLFRDIDEALLMRLQHQSFSSLDPHSWVNEWKDLLTETVALAPDRYVGYSH